MEMLFYKVFLRLIGSLLLTLLIEGLIAYVMGVKKDYDQTALAAINVMTNLIINLIVLLVGSTTKNYYLTHSLLLTFEIAVIFVEYLLFKKYISADINKLKLSTILNVSSFSIGLVISLLINLI